MQIISFKQNNVNIEKYELLLNNSYSIGGLSGSGKTSFCKEISNESLRRIISLLPKSDYKFIFPNISFENYTSSNIKDIPLIFFLKKPSFSQNPRSTLGTHAGVFKEIRKKFSKENNLPSEVFSFNTPIYCCKKCHGKGVFSSKICPTCNGDRYDNEILKYKIETKLGKKTIVDINKMTIEELLYLKNDLEFKSDTIEILENLINLRIGYLSLERSLNTLSGGETIRLYLSEFLQHSQNCVFILDEISSGLDKYTLAKLFEEIKIIGKNNQLYFIDHSDYVLNSAEKIIYFGPKSGKDGGQIIKESPRPIAEYYEIKKEEVKEYYKFYNLKKRNIKINEFKFPQNRITGITGESGCGKSTLIRDCMYPEFSKIYKKEEIYYVSQNRNQSITSKSTLATFLDLNNDLKNQNFNKFNIPIEEWWNDRIKMSEENKKKIKLLISLGLNYLSLDRKTQSLSSGEFQCINLILELFKEKGKKKVFIFDEPSKGLSQNILNNLMSVFKEIISDKNNTILFIEHNEYMLNSCDYIVDFGNRKEDVTELELLTNEAWTRDEKIYQPLKIESNISVNTGIERIKENVDSYYNNKENEFKGGLLKRLSQTAKWIYSDYDCQNLKPILTFDLEKKLFSQNTYIYEFNSIITNIFKVIDKETNNKVGSNFNYYNQENICNCCKGKRKIDRYQIEKIFKDESKGLFDGLFPDDIMKELKKYNFTKIKFLFKEIKKESGLNLLTEYNHMSDSEKNVFLYGYWKNLFYDKDKSTYREWKGILFLVKKYLKGVNHSYKDNLKDETQIECPECKGTLLNHNEKLIYKEKDIREILSLNLKDLKDIFSNDEWINELENFLGLETNLYKDIYELPHNVQVKLKLLEILNSNLIGYEIFLKNVEPFYSEIKDLIDKISKKNKIILCDYDGIDFTKDEILAKFFYKKEKKYVYEVLGYKGISTKINKFKIKNKCKFCDGKGHNIVENIHEGIEHFKIECSACNSTGFSSLVYTEIIEGFPIKTWLLGKVEEIKKDTTIGDLKLFDRIELLNKKELILLKNYINEEAR